MMCPSKVMNEGEAYSTTLSVRTLVRVGRCNLTLSESLVTRMFLAFPRVWSFGLRRGLVLNWRGRQAWACYTEEILAKSVEDWRL